MNRPHPLRLFSTREAAYHPLSNPYYSAIAVPSIFGTNPTATPLLRDAAAAVVILSQVQRTITNHKFRSKWLRILSNAIAQRLPATLSGSLAALSLTCLPVRSATWYGAADGTNTNGTRELPWAISYAVSENNSHLQPGDTVILKDGTFTCTEAGLPAVNYGHQLAFRKSGTPSAKITYRSETLWGFHFDGGLYIGTATSNIVLWGFNIYWSGISARANTNNEAFTGGITELGHGNEILHNIVGNTGHPGIASWSSTRGKQITGNIIRFIGADDSVNYTPGIPNPSGSGMYLQNDSGSPQALISGNISYFNYTTAMKAYGNADIWDFKFLHNIAAMSDEAGIFFHQDKVDAQGVQIISNFTWNAGIRLGYSRGNASPRNAVLVGNYSVGNHQDGVFAIEDGWKDCLVTNNTFVNSVYRYMVSCEASGQTNYLQTHFWDYNTYHAGVKGGYGTWDFRIGETGCLLPEWKARIRGDSHSSILGTLPTTTVSFPFAPSHDSNFVHVAVYNWPTNATETVGLAQYFSAGDLLSIYDAQDVPNAYTNIVFNGSTVVLDLRRTNYAPMLGRFSRKSEFWNGFDARFRAFVIHRQSKTPRAPLELKLQR